MSSRSTTPRAISASAPDVTLTVKNGTIVNTNKDSYGLYTYATNDNITVALEEYLRFKRKS